jgi:AcrR family transcriptional regulator
LPVNPENPARRSQAERSATTRQALLASARALFTERGFSATAREDIVERAGVTRGALYHHFANKEAVFRAVFEDLERELAERIATAAVAAPDPLAQLRLGCEAFLDAASDPAVRRIALTDAPAVLGWQTWRAIEAEHGLGLMREVLQAAMDAGQVATRPVESMAHLLLAALTEAALLVASAPDHAAVRVEVGDTVDALITMLSTRPTAPLRRRGVRGGSSRPRPPSRPS